MAEQLALEENLRRKADDEVGALARLVEMYEEQTPRAGRRPALEGVRFNRQVGALVGPVARAAEMTGQSVRDTQRKLRIGKLATAKVRKALAVGQLNVLEAEQLAGLDRKQQDCQLAALVKRKAELPPELRRVTESLSTSSRPFDERLGTPGDSRRAGGAGEERNRHHQGAWFNARPEIRTEEAGGENRRPEEADREHLGDRLLSPQSYNRKLGPVGHIASGDRPAAADAAVRQLDRPADFGDRPESCVFKGRRRRGRLLRQRRVFANQDPPTGGGGCRLPTEVVREEAHKSTEHFAAGEFRRTGSRRQGPSAPCFW